MEKALSWINKVTIIIIILIIALFVFGSFIAGRGCFSIGECKQCWSWAPRLVKSEYCPDANKTCISDPMVDQHNALVDVIMCACNSARDNAYMNEGLNNEIKRVYQEITGYSANTKEICENPDLVKWKY